jgi:hypothetical protein
MKGADSLSVCLFSASFLSFQGVSKLPVRVGDPILRWLLFVILTIVLLFILHTKDMSGLCTMFTILNDSSYFCVLLPLSFTPSDILAFFSFSLQNSL